MNVNRIDRSGPLVVLLLVSLVFWRGILESFDLTKGTILWVLGPALLLPIASNFQRLFDPRVRSFVIVAVSFMLACAVATATSMRPWQSLWGQNQRYTGMLTLLWSVVASVAIAVAWSRDDKAARGFALTTVAITTVMITYFLLQASGNDPFEWSITSFGRPVFSTMGNPNTASGMLSCLVPFPLWWLSQSSSPRLVRIGMSALVGATGAALGVLNSFQGNAALLVCVLLFAAALMSSTESLLRLVCLIGVGLIAVVGSLTSSTAAEVLFFGLAGGLAGAVVVWVDLRIPNVGGCPKKSVVRTRYGTSAVLVIVGVAVTWNRLASEFEGGMLERKYFYRAAWDAFVDRPILGYGLETFGLVFTKFRPFEHAFTLEQSRSSSVHSVPLAMFANGGLILGLTYLAFVAFVSWKAFVLFRRQQGSRWSKAIATTWFCITVQSSVSVEHVALLFMLFSVAGLVVADELRTSSDEVVLARKATGRRSRSGRTSPAISILVGSLVIVSVFVSTGLFRASRDFLTASRALYVDNDPESALQSMRSSVSTAFWEPVYRFQWAMALERTGSSEQAADEAMRAVKEGNFPASIGLDASVLLARVARFDDAASVLRSTVSNDPFARDLRLGAIDLLRQISSAASQLGDSNSSRFDELATTLSDEATELGIELSSTPEG